MHTSRFASAIRIFGAWADYALVVVLAAIVSTWGLVVRFGFDPDPTRVVRDYEGLVVMATVVAMWFFVSRAWRHPWFSACRHRLVLGAVAVLGLGVIVWMQVRAFIYDAEVNRGALGDDAVHLLIIQCALFLLALVVLFSIRRMALKRGWLSVPVRVALVTGLAAYLFYLTWDEPVAPSIVRNREVMQGRSEDEVSYRLTLRYTPAAGGKVFMPPSRTIDFGQQGEKRRAHLLEHRKEIEANWAEMTEVRAWWSEMAAQSQIGDRAENGFDQPVIRFQPVRSYMQHALSIACLRALDGDGDGALAIVDDVYAVGARLEPASRTLMRSMTARVIQKASLEAAEFVLSNATVSTDARVRLVDLLSAPQGGGLGAKRLVLTDSASFYMSGKGIATFAQLSGRLPKETVMSYIGRSANALILSVTLNPQATANLANDRLEKTALLAEANNAAELQKLENDMHAETLGHFRVKNISGRLLLPMMTSNYFNLVKNYWDIEARRDALLERLRELPPAAGE